MEARSKGWAGAHQISGCVQFLGRPSTTSQAPSHQSRAAVKIRENEGGSQAPSRDVSGSQVAKKSERTGRGPMKSLLRTAAFKKRDENVSHRPMSFLYNTSGSLCAIIKLWPTCVNLSKCLSPDEPSRTLIDIALY